MIDLEDLLMATVKTAFSVAVDIKEGRKKFNPQQVTEKSAHNFVTNIDKEAEQKLVKELSQLLPEAGFVTEEGTASLTNEPYCWVIDPLDGTTNYIHNLGPYCISIALRDANEILLGLVLEITQGEVFSAVKDQQARMNGKPTTVSTTATIDQSFIALGLPYNADAYKPTAQRLIDRLYGHSAGCRILGSAAAEICYVACGRFDGRIEAHLSPWDVSAAGFILQQAGGRITDFSGGPDWTSGREVIASNTKLHDALLKLLV